MNALKKSSFKALYSSQLISELKFLNETEKVQKEVNQNAWIQKGEKCWIYLQDDPDVYAKGIIISDPDIEYKKIELEIQKTKKTIFFPANSLMMRSEDVSEENNSFKSKDDMIDMECLNEAELLYNLSVRLKNNLMYTYVGTTIIAVNPFCEIPDLYGPASLYKFFSKFIIEQLPLNNKHIIPHVYAIAACCYNDLFSYEKNQSIVISGESGAGKTENTKHAMKFLTSIGHFLKQLKNGGQTDSHQLDQSNQVSIEDKILSCNPVLEAYGNAKTSANDNSSRFGKYVTLIVEKSSKSVIGANIENYLLEKARITNLEDGQRNFHIFYHFLLGAGDETLQKYFLNPVKQPKDLKFYNYLNQSKVIKVDNLKDKDLYQEVCESYDKLNFTEYVDSLNRIISSILLLGNNVWDESTLDGQDKGCQFQDQTLLKNIASLLCVDHLELQKSLSFKLIRQKELIITAPYDQKASKYQVYSFSKYLFSQMFNWIVEKLNQTIIPKEISNFSERDIQLYPSIGILDIYGFETFQINGFEQFFINYTNEKLQSLYITYVFKQEEKIFEAEGLGDAYKSIIFSDNSEVMDMLDNKNNGIFSIIDEQCTFTSSTDKSLLEALEGKHKNNKYFKKDKLSKLNEFIVHHSVKSVTYSTNGFLEKNMDDVQELCLQIVAQSSNKYIQGIYQQNYLDYKEQLAQKGKNPKLKFLGYKFRLNLQQLMSTLLACDCYFIRCIKSNKKKSKLFFQTDMCLEQIRSLGVLETIKVRKESYPIRRTYDIFFRKYQLMSKVFTQYVELLQNKADFKKLSMEMIEKQLPLLWNESKKSDSVLLFGKNRIFMKMSAVNFLDKQYNIKIHKLKNSANKIKYLFKRQKNQKIITKSFIQVICFVRLIRAFRHRQKFKKIRKYVNKMIQFWKGKQLDKEKKTRKNNIMIIQKYLQSRLDQNFWVMTKACAKKIQHNYKSKKLKEKFINIVNQNSMLMRIIKQACQVSWNRILSRFAITIQRYARGYIVKVMYPEEVQKIRNTRINLRMNKAAVIIQSNFKGYVKRKLYQNMRKSVTQISAWIRGLWQRRYFLDLRYHTIIIQRWMRKILKINKAIRDKLNKYLDEVQLEKKIQAENQILFGSSVKVQSPSKIVQTTPKYSKIVQTTPKYSKDVKKSSKLQTPNSKKKKNQQSESSDSQGEEIEEIGLIQSSSQIKLKQQVPSLQRSPYASNELKNISYQQATEFQQEYFEIAYKHELQDKIYFFSYVLDLHIISDLYECYMNPWSQTYKELFNKNYQKQQFVQFLQVGETHTLIANNNNQLFSFGQNNLGQLGYRHKIDQFDAINNFVELGTNQIQIQQFSNGTDHNIILDNDGKIYGWGSNENSQFPMFSESSIKVPTLIPLPEDFSVVFCSQNITYCISKETQQVYKFGYENKNIKKPKIIVFPEPKIKIQAISCGKDFTVFLTNFQILYGYGDNSFGQLGLGDIKHRKNPCLISFNKDTTEFVQNVYCGYKHVICKTTNQKIFTWGSGKSGQLGHGELKDYYIPTRLKSDIISADRIIQVVASFQASLLLQNDGKIIWFGTNSKIKKQKTPIEINLQEILPNFSTNEYQVIRIQSSFSQMLSVINITIALDKKFNDGESFKKQKLYNNITQKWIQTNINSVMPPYIESAAKYISHSSMKMIKEKNNKKN